jgi:hypothetical protein
MSEQILREFLEGLKVRAEWARVTTAAGVDRYAALCDVVRALELALLAPPTDKEVKP